MRLDWFLYHVASGHAYFSGLALIAAAVAAAASGGGRVRRVAPLLAVLGVLLVAVSATPLPWGAYAAGAAVLVAWAVTESRRDRVARRTAVIARAGVAAALALAAAAELPYHVSPRVAPRPAERLAVIGDSVTAGIGEDEAVTWPRLLAKRHRIEVRDHSAMGATVASARRQAAKLRP